MIFNILLFFLLTVRLSKSDEGPIVTTSLGKIKGHYRVSYNENKYEAYEGIPFALPPVGPRRFEVSKQKLTKLCPLTFEKILTYAASSTG